MMCVVDKHYREVDGITLTRYEVVVTEILEYGTNITIQDRLTMLYCFEASTA